MTKKNPPTPAALDLSFEDAMGELEALVDQLNAGQLPLEQLLQSYARGADLLNHCQAKLQAVEQQVKVLEGGQLKAWDNAA
jgi:exodeoxyribonuclease VII small subunit